jgi:hypothetical protein
MSNPLAPTATDVSQIDAGPYFNNPTVIANVPSGDKTPDLTWNFSGRPRMVDQFILISAGSDGIYGTADDITNFGDVIP